MAAGKPAFRSENRLLSACAPGNPQAFSGNRRGRRGGPLSAQRKKRQEIARLQSAERTALRREALENLGGVQGALLRNEPLHPGRGNPWNGEV